jgi:hypothetical protein
MSVYDFYITPEEYEIAEQNGISNTTLNQRVRELGWEKERALTEPPRGQFKRYDKDLLDIAKQNGIPYNTFYHRVNRDGFTPEDAATAPLMETSEVVKRARKARRRKYPLKYINLAKENGISYGTFCKRVRRGWTLEDAATIPLISRKEIAKMWSHGRDHVLDKKRNQQQLKDEA